MNDKHSDEELIRQHLSGQSSPCLEALYSRYADKVYRQCLSLTHDTEKARDLTHDIFIKVFDKLGHFQYRSRFSSWLFSITHNYCMDQLRGAQRFNPLSFDDRLTGSLADSQEAQEYEEQLQRRERALLQVSVWEQTFLRLKYEEGLSLKQLAEMFDLRVDVVKMRLKRSRDRVQRVYYSAQTNL
ncbi:RNA polymerase sigma factor [Spirosoma koreense]